MNTKNIIMTAAMGCIIFFTGGCANHLRDIDVVSQENDRKVLSTKYELKLLPETVKDASYHVEIQKLESAEVKKYEVRTVKNIVTPYQWWREFYEIPTSFVLLPVSIGAHVLFIGTVGILPYSVPSSITDLAFTGLNPALNWESSTRKEERLVSIDRKMLSNTTENMTIPLAKEKIIVCSGNQRKVFTTDDFGGFDLNFLALQENDTFFPAARKVSFLLESDKNKELKNLILTRAYLSKLLWARTKINAYKMNPSGKNLFDTVIYLEKNGFELLAYTLEESELARKAKDKKFQTDFKSTAAKQ